MKSVPPLQNSVTLDTAHFGDNTVSLFGVRDIRVSSISYSEELQKKNKTMNASSSPGHLCSYVADSGQQVLLILYVPREASKALQTQSSSQLARMGWEDAPEGRVGHSLSSYISEVS